METKKDLNIKDPVIKELFGAGAHFAYVKSRRHPSAKPFIFGAKNRVEIFNLEKTKEELEKAKDFVRKLGAENAMILFVGGKHEAQALIKKSAESIDMPYVAGRWIGGSLTNYPQIKKRIEKLETLLSQKEKGELGKYTKKERVLIDREIENLEKYFSGLIAMRDLPKAMFVVDSKREHIAVAEAHEKKIPVISLSGSDCDLKDVAYAIPANDTSVDSISFFLKEIVSAYKEGKSAK